VKRQRKKKVLRLEAGRMEVCELELDRDEERDIYIPRWEN